MGLFSPPQPPPHSSSQTILAQTQDPLDEDSFSHVKIAIETARERDAIKTHFPAHHDVHY